MKKNWVFLVLVLVMALSPISTIAQSGFVESKNRISNGKIEPLMNLYLRDAISDKWGWSSLFSISKTWSEFYAGPTYTPTKWVELSLNIGMETNKNPTRYAWSMWIGGNRSSFFLLNENRGSGKFRKMIGTYCATKRLTLGVANQTGLGAGPYIDFKIGKSKKVSVWIIVLKKQLHLGIQTKF